MTLNLNFFKSELIESYTFQLYFMLHSLLKLKRIFFHDNSRIKNKWRISKFRFIYLKKFYALISRSYLNSQVIQRNLAIPDTPLRRFIGSK